LPLDFSSAAASLVRETFGGATVADAADPDDAGNAVLQFTRPAGTDWWSGWVIDLDTAVDATTGTFTVDVYSTIALDYVELKLEQDGGNLSIMTTTHGGTGWETLTFDTASGTVTGAPGAATVVVMTPRITNDGDVATNPTVDEVYYFDDIAVGATPAPTVALPLDFSSAAASLVRETFGGATVADAADPDDAGNAVLQFTRPAGTDWWSGWVIDLDTAVDATTGTFTVDVYSTIALDYVELKLEQDGGNLSIMTTTHGGTGWETLTFDTASGTVTGAPGAATVVVMTPRITNDGDVATNPTVDEVYYFDDISRN